MNHTSWVHSGADKTLTGLMPIIPEWLAMLICLVAIIGFVCVSVLALVWLERKISARIQMRTGPMMVGPRWMAEQSMWLGGLFQTAADAIKMLTKEMIVPGRADPLPFVLAPIFIVTVCLTAFVVLPFGPALSVSDLNIGILHIVAISSLTVLSIIMAGWSSNNKYSLLGGLRSAAQMLSYEIPLIFALLGPILLAGTLSMQGIVLAQAQMGLWFVVPSLLGFVIYFVASIAEVNRPPFDIPEAESELVAGYVSEYSGMMFAMFFLAEFANMFLVCGVAATVFLGGWLVPFAPIPSHDSSWIWIYRLAGVAVFFVKTMALVLVMMWIRWTFPRVRPDHLMNLGWKYMLPGALLNLLLCAVVAIVRMRGHSSPLMLGFACVLAWILVLGIAEQIRRPKPEVSR